MSQLTLNITNEKIMDKLLWMLEHFKSDGVEIVKPETRNQKPETELTDEYMQKNWRELVMTSGDNSEYYKSEQYYEDRAEDYKQRGKV